MARKTGRPSGPPPGAKSIFGRGTALSKGRIQGLMSFYLNRLNRNKRSTIRLNRLQDQRAKALADVIMAPCCYTQPASIHGNAVAGAVKATLRWLISQGHSDKDIKAAFVKAYHPHVLSASSKKSIFVIPLVAAILALFFVGFVVVRWSRRGAATPDGAIIDEDYDENDEYDEYEEDDEDDKADEPNRGVTI